MTEPHDRRTADALAAYEAHGDHTHVLTALLRERIWRGEGDAVVVYAATPGAWVAAGAPLTSAARAPDAAAAFAANARAAGRVAVWFGLEDPARLPGWRHLAVGALPEWSLPGWTKALATHRRLREQLRRARAKGVTVRALDLASLARAEEEVLARLERVWSRSRRMEPMGFVVAHEQAADPVHRRAWIAERNGRAVAYVTATAIPARQAWLLEDVRRDGAPNGSSELLFDTAVRELAAAGAAWITPGMVPLAGVEQRWLQLVRRVTRPIYDFDGLKFFRARLHPDRWRPVYLAYASDVSAPRAVVETLRAFAGGSVVGFAWRSLMHRPAVLAWALAVGLVPWTLCIAAMALLGLDGLLGYSRLELVGWTAFDALLAGLLWAAGRTQRARLFALALLGAAGDAAVSLWHLAEVGLGESFAQVTMRSLSVGAPIIASVALAAALRALTRGRRAEARVSAAGPATAAPTPQG